jgi:hypothetical protein
MKMMTRKTMTAPAAISHDVKFMTTSLESAPHRQGLDREKGILHE